MSFDFNADHYSRLELLSVLELPPNASTVDILNAVNPYILKYTSENNAPFLGFFVRARDILINGTVPPKLAMEDNIILTNQKVETEETPHQDVNERVQNESGNSFGIPIKQDILNPNLKNVVTRLIHLDSQFRQSTIAGSATDYTLDLSDPLRNVLSLRLYSIQIPFSWYIIDAQYNNNVFWVSISEPSISSILITMPSGNYTPTTFVSTMNVVLKTAIPDISGSPVSYNESTGKVTLTLITNEQTHIVSIIFFDFEGKLATAPYVNSTLGWLMGYRNAIINVDPSGNVADGVLDLYGTKNLIFVLDDYNQNHVNNGLISITEISKTLSLPSYYRPDLSFNVMPPTTTYNNNISDYGDSAVKTFKSVPIMQPTAPRLLTQSQIYTVNEIMKSREQTMSYRVRAPTSPDIFAMIPIKRSSAKVGDVYVEFGSSLQTNMRVYFGPVNIERMRIRLLDDKGNAINLNGMDWSITLISENLYQY
jgi:hypothetical protein